MKQLRVNRIWMKTLVVTAIAVVAAETISYVSRALLNQPADHVTLMMVSILPVIIAMPIALFVFRQTEQLNRAHAALIIANETLARKASRDHMTGLLNRESFLNQVDVARLSPGGGALLIVDADHFKTINDRHGHPAGDDALTRIASAITAAVRKGDLVGRIGGEEFSAFLVGADQQEALRVAQRVCAMVEGVDFSVQGERIRLTVSVGGAIADAQPDLGDLMRQADACLYQAKRGGRNRVIIGNGLTVAA